jgi:hypothetical protein
MNDLSFNAVVFETLIEWMAYQTINPLIPVISDAVILFVYLL